MVADHWFRQVERVLEAMEITSGATRIRLLTFQLADESQIWWDWVKTSKNVEAMTWGYFKELFMSKFFPASACQGPRVYRLAAGRHDNAGVHG